MSELGVQFLVVRRWRKGEFLVIFVLSEVLVASSILVLSSRSNVIAERKIYKDVERCVLFFFSDIFDSCSTNSLISIFLHYKHRHHTHKQEHNYSPEPILHSKTHLPHPNSLQYDDPNLLLQHIHASHHAYDRRCPNYRRRELDKFKPEWTVTGRKRESGSRIRSQLGGGGQLSLVCRIEFHHIHGPFPQLADGQHHRLTRRRHHRLARGP